jgi:hypothetical protein
LHLPLEKGLEIVLFLLEILLRLRLIGDHLDLKTRAKALFDILRSLTYLDYSLEDDANLRPYLLCFFNVLS